MEERTKSSTTSDVDYRIPSDTQGHDPSVPETILPGTSKSPGRLTLSMYRLLSIIIGLTVGTVEGIRSLNEGSNPTPWTEWAGRALFVVIWYYIGLYESTQPPVALWFFHEDYTADAFYLPLGAVIAFLSGCICASIALLFFWLMIFCAKSLPIQPTLEMGGWAYLLVPPIMITTLAGLIVVTVVSYFLAARSWRVAKVIFHSIPQRYRSFLDSYPLRVVSFFKSGFMTRWQMYSEVYKFTVVATMTIGFWGTLFTAFRFFTAIKP